jgi:tetratricopeptide (TPR) repeat protein
MDYMKKSYITIALVLTIPLFSFFENYYAHKAYGKDEYDAAYERYASLAADAQGKDSRSLYNMGVISYRQKEYEKAKFCFEKSADVPELSSAQRVQLHYNLGKTYEKLQQYDDAEKNYDTVLSYDPDNELAQRAKEELKKKREQREQEQKASETSEPAEQANDDNEGQRDTHNQKENKKRQDDQSTQRTGDKEEHTQSDSQKQREDQPHGGKEQANNHEQQSDANQAEDKSVSDDVHDNSSQKAKKQLTNSNSNMNSESEQKAMMATDERLTSTDKELLAFIAQVDDQVQKEYMKATLHKQPVKHGQKQW